MKHENKNDAHVSTLKTPQIKSLFYILWINENYIYIFLQSTVFLDIVS